MIGYQIPLTYLIEKDYSIHVEPRDNSKYVMKGIESTSFHLDSRDSLHMSGILVYTRVEEQPPKYLGFGGKRMYSFLCIH